MAILDANGVPRDPDRVDAGPVHCHLTSTVPGRTCTHRLDPVRLAADVVTSEAHVVSRHHAGSIAMDPVLSGRCHER